MKKRRPTLGDLMILIGLVASDLAGYIWAVRSLKLASGPMPRSDGWSGIEFALVSTVIFWPFLILSGVILLYVPPKLDGILWTLLVLALLVILILPALQHSR